VTAASVAGATFPAAEAGAISPPIDCGTLLIPGTGTYSTTNFQFTEFATGSATRDSGTVNGSSDGAVAYGGALSTYPSTPYFTVASAISPPPSEPTAVIGGSETYDLVVAHGSAAIAGSNEGVDFVGGGTMLPGPLPFSFPGIQGALGTCSTTYVTHTVANGTVAAAGATLELTGTAATSNVFRVPESELTGITTIEFDVPAGSTTLVK
jgi:choice-of-anchor A domain-containing protein